MPVAARITCVVGQAGKVSDLPRLPLSLLDKSLSQWFAENTEGTIDLRMNYTKAQEQYLGNRRRVVAYDLNERLGMLTGNAEAQGRVNRIGLILSSSFDPAPHVYGVMFDCGAPTDADPRPNWRHMAVPREGCAVFLSRIGEDVHGAAFDDEVAYTAIHEIGHVFNLIHSKGQLNFMHETATFGQKGEDTAKFLPTDVSWLKQCSDSDNVHPGGSLFRDCGDLAEGLSPPAHKYPKGSPIALEIDMLPKEFWRFEPVELDVRLRVKRGHSGAYRVRDRLDPGYEEFSIFITEPDGERRRFRAMRHYCARERSIVITKEAPFQRDISLFREPGGFTFRKAGLHRIQAEFDLGHRGGLRSNVVEVYVRTATPGHGEYDRAFAALAREESASCLYYRQADARSQAWRRLVSYFRNESTDQINAAVAYALGRTTLDVLDRTDGSARDRKRRLEFSQRCLERCLQSSTLGRRRTQIAELLLSSGQHPRRVER